MARPHPAHIITDDSAIGGKIIEKSVRCNLADNAYFTRTSDEAGDRRTFTLSGWFKFCRTETTDVGQDFIFYSGTSLSEQLQLSREGNAQINFEPKNSGSTAARFYTKTKFRDHSWYHLVLKIDTTQSTESDRMAFYVNGVQEDYDTDIVATTYPSQNLEFNWGSNSERYDMMRRTISGYLTNSDGAIADVHYVSGYAYDPTAFGYFDDQTGIWRPKKYTGSYGSAGWHLEFKDNSATTATTLGKDTSGNGNNWTPTNISTHDVLLDTPTNVFCTHSPLDDDHTSASAFSEGNLKIVRTGNNHGSTRGTMGMSSGKWYFEYCYTSTTNSGAAPWAGVCNSTADITGFRTSGMWNYGSSSGQYLVRDGTSYDWGSAISGGTVLGVAIDMDNKKIWIAENNTWFGSSNNDTDGNPSTGANPTDTFADSDIPDGNLYPQMGSYSYDAIKANFGQDSSFSGTKTAQGNTDANGIGDFFYAPPTGFKALCSLNLPPSSSPVIRPKRHFDTILYTGNNSTNNITGLEFEPDMIWIKSRGQNYPPYIFDRLRDNFGDNLRTDSNAQEPTDGTALTGAFDGGFSTSGASGINDSGSGTDGFVAWCWKGGGTAVSNTDGSITTSISANQEAGFSIVTWTGNGSNSTVGHGLGKVPKWIVCKLRDTTTQDWFFNPGEITGDRGKYMKFNTASAIVSDIHTFPPTAATSTVFTVGGEDGGNSSNGNGSKYVAYCWAEIPGYSKIGKYEGNSNADGTFVNCGFRPGWIIVKKSTDDNWPVYDYKRDPHNVGDHRLFSDTNNTEGAVGQEHVDFLSNGFKWRRSKNPFNNDGSTYFYMAFAQQPGLTPFHTFPSAR